MLARGRAPAPAGVGARLRAVVGHQDEQDRGTAVTLGEAIDRHGADALRYSCSESARQRRRLHVGALTHVASRSSPTAIGNLVSRAAHEIVDYGHARIGAVPIDRLASVTAVPAVLLILVPDHCT